MVPELVQLGSRWFQKVPKNSVCRISIASGLVPELVQLGSRWFQKVPKNKCLPDFHRKRLGSGVGSAWFQMVPKNSVVFVDGMTGTLDEALGVLGYTTEVLC